jgi:hypothetical protein
MKNIEHSRLTCAVGAALGLKLIQSAEMEHDGGEVSILTIKLIATEDQIKAIGEYLAKDKSASTDALRLLT